MLGFGYPVEHALPVSSNWLSLLAAAVVTLIVLYSIFEQALTARRQRRRAVVTELPREERKAA